jgi:hypothetical protein
VLANEMHRFAARAQDDGRHNQLPGGRIVYELDAATHKPDVLVRALTEEGEERTFTPPAAPAEGAAAQSVTVPMRELQSLGLFEARVALQAGPVDRRLFARNVPPVEGRLRRAAGADVFKAYPPGLEERLQFVDAETLVQGLGQSPRSDLWRALAIGLVVALLLETLLAWRFGGRK